MEETTKKVDTTKKVETNKFFENKIKPILLYVGTIGAIAMAIAYIILMVIMVVGFKAQAGFVRSITFALINAIVGFIIMQFLKIQGLDFAKNIPSNAEILDKYNKKRPKQKRTHSLGYFWVRSVIGDILFKVFTVAITTAGIIYIVIEGSNDYTLILLSAVNLIMFACFGLVSLVKAYDFYNDSYIPYLIELGEQNERENQKALEMAKDELIKQGNVALYDNGGNNLLDSSVDTRDTCDNNKSLVLDSGFSGDSVLGRSIHTSSAATNRSDISIEKNT